jgi:hypothetical protein
VGSLGVRLIKNSVVYPTIRVPSRPNTLLMGVYDEDDNYVDDTAVRRRIGEQTAPVPPGLFPDVSDSDEPEVIYGGPLYFHFGHFLLESLSRAWYAHEHPDVPFAWAGAHTWQQAKLRRWQSEILDVLMIENPTRIIADPTRFEQLHVPDVGYRYDDWLDPEHAAFLGRYEGPAQLRGRRLWLSRSRIEGTVRDLNSESTERRLAHAGWTIAYPETLSIREQLDHLARAETVAGEEGSAFHALILLKDVSSKKFHIFRRHGGEHLKMHTIGDVRHVDQRFYSLERERVLKAEGRVVSKITPNSSEILDILDVRVPAAPDPASASEDDAILGRALAGLEPRRFLDVGSRTPHLVVGSTAQTRVAVSQTFEFDTRSYAGSGIGFYELGLSQYADVFHTDRDPFDVIRLTGPAFTDVMAAFRVSRSLAHEDTTWILGSGDLAARVALAIQLTYPGFTARRLIVKRTTVYVARRAPGEPVNEVGVGELPAEEVRSRVRWIRPSSWRLLRRRTADSNAVDRNKRGATATPSQRRRGVEQELRAAPAHRDAAQGKGHDGAAARNSHPDQRDQQDEGGEQLSGVDVLEGDVGEADHEQTGGVDAGPDEGAVEHDQAEQQHVAHADQDGHRNERHRRRTEQPLVDALPVLGEAGGLLAPLPLDGEVTEHLARTDPDVDHERTETEGGHHGTEERSERSRAVGVRLAVKAPRGGAHATGSTPGDPASQLDEEVDADHRDNRHGRGAQQTGDDRAGAGPDRATPEKAP